MAYGTFAELARKAYVEEGFALSGGAGKRATVSSVLVHPDALPAFRELSTRKSQLLLEEYHSWLSNHEVSPEDESSVQPCYVAVGIYYSDYPGTGEE